MSVFILDTDTLSLIQHRAPVVVSALVAARAAGNTIGITAVTAEEQANGWFTAFRQSKDHADLARASLRFCDAILSWGQFTIFPQTEASLARFDALVALKLNVGKMDLRIAGIALELGATVVTHNARDFGRVPGLLTADWTVPPAPPAPDPTPP